MSVNAATVKSKDLLWNKKKARVPCWNTAISLDLKISQFLKTTFWGIVCLLKTKNYDKLKLILRLLTSLMKKTSHNLDFTKKICHNGSKWTKNWPKHLRETQAVISYWGRQETMQGKAQFRASSEELQNFCGKSFLTKILPVNNLGKIKSKYMIRNICWFSYCWYLFTFASWKTYIVQ